ncbi:hypothetical protein D0T84_08205 [Dysgonomonas sp. 521]|uniref:carboxypeptidase-like regulatory domain-containing protein n=1 Tax=Dysgonomonas sp. 521 TaxID=2302932 RepID=UPI0013CFCAFB|nr:carboxypeptidase-like regulatory domain-containing protein [Dysgonomonas sp. 521]NDV94898.1 hypothetical protein [Dysgonomonas sp. 521]
MRILYTTLFLSLFILQSFAQQYTITGRISRESDNKGLKGVHIAVKDDEIYTTSISDENGLYQIEVNKGDTLTFWGMGYKKQEIKVKKKKYNIKLEEDEDFFGIFAELSGMVTKLRKENSDIYRKPVCPPCPGEKEIEKKPDSLHSQAKQKIVITGNITHQGSEKNLAFVQVTVKNTEKQYNFSLSNKDGKYGIMANIGDTLIFSRFRYHPARIGVTGNEHNISLIPNKKKYTPDELQAILDDLNFQINRLREENSILRKPRPCPPCPPVEEDNNI